MYCRNDIIVTSASDLSLASSCEFGFARKLDALLGRLPTLDVERDEMLKRTAALGDEHEARMLARYRTTFGTQVVTLDSGFASIAPSQGVDGAIVRQGGVVEIPAPDLRVSGALDQAVQLTAQAFSAGAAVVFQATFADDDPDDAFIGFADFIVRQPDGRYLVQDTKLARSAKVTALLQLAAYAERLDRIGVPVADTVELLLGDGAVSAHRVQDVMPVYRNRWRRLRQLVRHRVADDQPVRWGDEHHALCGQCDECAAAISEHRDVLQVAGLRVSQRERLRQAGIESVDALADSSVAVPGIGTGTLDGLRTQAKLQLRAEADQPPPIELIDPSALAAIPPPDPGDIFFDFEGDPLHTEGNAERWGLDYLFGLVDTDEQFTAWWAHSFREEREALLNFLAFVRERRQRHPRMHIYHYASYERTHLLSIAARHGVGEDDIDQLLGEHALVDLYPIVRKSLRVGSDSYSIKRLEPLYMGDELRTAEVTNAAASITEYANARQLIADGDTAAGEHKLQEIADYNRYDCVSTLRLRDWLLGHARAHGVEAALVPNAPAAPDGDEPSRLHGDLLTIAGDPMAVDRGVDDTAAALAAAALDYHRRENKSFWWGHFDRLVAPIDEWAETRDVLVIEDVTVERDWFREGQQQNDRRHLRLRGTLAPGSSIKPSMRPGPFALYAPPGPLDPDGRSAPGARGARRVSVLEIADDGSVLVCEALPKTAGRHDDLPIALTPAAPPNPGCQPEAIGEWAQTIVDAQPGWPSDPVTDILRRVPPRTRSGGLAPVASDGGDRVQTLTSSLLDLDGSWIAVQGPPGTGKTYLGSHVIAELVRDHRWKIGVVAQSHAVVEHMLGAITKAGLAQHLVGKARKTGDTTDAAAFPFTVLPSRQQAAFAAEHDQTGFVLGGTAWDFSDHKRIPRGSLDLLVIDEAGQFSLASTIASAVSARSLLLLGDPQQLPQVSQGAHPEPVDQSALGWISAGHDVLPPHLGYFLAESYRMHPAVTAAVSDLAYEGQLGSHPSASERHLDRIAAGVHVVPTEHRGNANASSEEAAEVLRIVEDALGTTWTEKGISRPVAEQDIIVVTPYNAQRTIVAEALATAGHGHVRVGTVDKFQGQEAVIAIVTLAASSPADVPRGMSFLIMKNRLNVALSRAKWAAFLIFSPDLVEYLPTTPDGVAELSAFIGLTDDGMSAQTEALGPS
ncbi:MAG: TM0106 family RecB-like putative nuclease [Patulibacter sp.]|nr:TM0106 family RecB-like putative nuclease [Patulibacter sp.]